MEKEEFKVKEIIATITNLENENTGYEYNINKLLLNENKVNELLELLENNEISLVNDLECYDEIIYTDKLNWLDFVYTIKNKIDKVNYLTSSDNYQYDKFREIITEAPETITVHINDKLGLGLVRYDLDQIILFDQEHEDEIEKMIENKMEAYILPKYDHYIIEKIIGEYEDQEEDYDM